MKVHRDLPKNTLCFAIFSFQSNSTNVKLALSENLRDGKPPRRAYLAVERLKSSVFLRSANHAQVIDPIWFDGDFGCFGRVWAGVREK